MSFKDYLKTLGVFTFALISIPFLVFGFVVYCGWVANFFLGH